MKAGLEGWGSGLLGVVIFSASLPATRVAVAGFAPLFLTSARAVIAALLAAALLLALRRAPSPSQPPSRPRRGDLVPLLVVACGVVIGFPLLTALALQHVTAARSIVFIGLLPLVTALFAVLRGGERPRPPFWLFSGLGSAVVAGFALLGGGGAVATGDALIGDAQIGDLLMLAAVAVCGLGYAEGAVLSRRLGGWQVICWALLLAAPAMAVVALLTLPDSWRGIGAAAWGGLAYVSAFSMLLGFVFWYRGLALGGIARVGQLQLLQPFFGLLLAAALLGEQVAWSMVAASGAIVLCVALARRFG